MPALPKPQSDKLGQRALREPIPVVDKPADHILSGLPETLLSVSGTPRAALPAQRCDPASNSY